MPDLSSLHPVIWVALFAIMLLAGLAHGVLGLGFALVSTILVTLITDIRMAIVVNLVPTLATTFISMLRGGNYRHSLGAYWSLPLYIMAGSYAGARLLLVSPQAPFTLLLAVLVLAYLQVERLELASWTAIKKHRQIATAIFGLAAGIANSTANIAAPPLLIYFLALQAEPKTIVQALNLCFFAAKSTQTATLVAVGRLGMGALGTSIPFAVVAVAAMLVGIRVRERVNAITYRRWMIKVLWVSVGLLLVQFFRQIS